jgi:hypothetical protein
MDEFRFGASWRGAWSVANGSSGLVREETVALSQ